MGQKKPFEHKPLIDPNRQFRAIAVSSRKKYKRLCCRLSVLDVETNRGTHYALSYLWGQEQPTHCIKVNGKILRVRQNLWHFLQHARTRFPDTWIFVDAICIDQANIEERSKQVQIMGDIYKHTSITLCWLGQGNAEIDQAIPFIQSVLSEDTDELIRYYHNAPSQRQQDWLSIFLLADLRYWSRTWIMQEVLKPSEIILLYGKHELGGNDTWEFLDLVRTIKPNIVPLTGNLSDSRLRQLSFMRSRGAHKVNATFATMRDILLEYAFSQCSVKKDRLFALRTLGTGRDLMRVNYSKSLAHLFMEALHLWGDQDGSNVLVLAKHLADALLPLPTDYETLQEGPATLVLKFLLVSKPEDPDQSCAARECVIRCYLGPDYTRFDEVYEKSPQDGRPLSRGKPLSRLPILSRVLPNHRSVECRPIEIKHSQLQCTDTILQIEDTSMFLVVGLNQGRYTIVARLAIIVEEVDQAPTFVGYWLPWSTKLANVCELTFLGNDQYQIGFNALGMRLFLVVVECEKFVLNIDEGSVISTLRTLRWQDEPEGTCSIGTIYKVQDEYRHCLQGWETKNLLSLSQAYQAFKTSKLDLAQPEEFRPAPSWRELIERT